MSAIIVVGAGIVGASVAYHAARRGMPVTLLDRGPSPAAGVTGGSFAWISGSGGNWPGGAGDLYGSVLADYRRLEAELPEVRVRWTGSLRWMEEDTGDDPLKPGQFWAGRDEIAALEPNLRAVPEQAVHTPTDGGANPVELVGALVRGARAHGAQVCPGTEVRALEHKDGRVTGVLSSAGFHPASTVVLAAGTEVRALCAPLGAQLPVAASPACLLQVSAPPGLVRTIVATPDFEVREIREGRLLVPEVGSWDPEDLERLARRTLERLRSMFRDAEECRLLEYRVSRRPMPQGGPLVGYVTPDQSVYVAVMHSAVALGPTVGRLVAEELATGEPVAELRRCRPLDIPSGL